MSSLERRYVSLALEHVKSKLEMSHIGGHALHTFRGQWYIWCVFPNDDIPYYVFGNIRDSIPRTEIYGCIINQCYSIPQLIHFIFYLFPTALSVVSRGKPIYLNSELKICTNSSGTGMMYKWHQAEEPKDERKRTWWKYRKYRRIK